MEEGVRGQGMGRVGGCVWGVLRGGVDWGWGVVWLVWGRVCVDWGLRGLGGLQVGWGCRVGGGL